MMQNIIHYFVRHITKIKFMKAILFAVITGGLVFSFANCSTSKKVIQAAPPAVNCEANI